MSRRRLVAIISAAALLLLGVVAAATVLSVTQTDLGRDYVRRYLQAQVASKLGKRGKMYIGRISGGLVTGVVVDSFAIRDEEDSLFVSAGPIEINYDPRDILDKRLFIGQLVVHKPFVNLRRHSDGVWNYRRIFPKGAPRVRTPDRRFGDYIVIDSATIHDGTVIVTMPWSPSDTLNARQRDSALAYARTTGGHEIRQTREGLKKTWRWTGLEVEAPFVRIADPDSAGKLVLVADMDVDETDPPFKFRNVRGPVRIGDDTVRFDLTHFDLPGSTGRARGMVHWKQQGPVRYDVQVAGDSVSLADIAWVYPTLPRQGGGRMLLHIINDARDPRVLDYRITRMDVRAARSHLVGDWTFGVGGPVLVVKDVDLRAEPVDFDLFRTLAGGPFPVDWQGTLTGTVRGRGGRLDRFMVDHADITFRDRHVPGAVTRATASGGVDILEPAFTKFLGLSLDIETLDLRTPQFLFADFPRLRGTISGTAVLDSSWLDVRFSEADVTLRDGGPGESHFTGSGRVTYGDLISFDVDLFAQPIDFTQFARSYPALPARGPQTGPLRVQGSMADLLLAATMRGDAGMMSVDGRFDLTAPRFAARMTGQVEDLDPRTLLARQDLLASRLTGRYSADLSGDSLANLDGTLAVDLDRSTVGGVRIFPSTAAFAFNSGLLRVDTLRVETTAATLTASGALSLGVPRPDSLHYTIVVDSLGGLRPWIPTDRAGRGARALASEDTATGARRDSLVSAYRDSLAGRVEVNGTLSGSINSLSTAGSVEGRSLFVAGDRARSVRGNFALTGLPRAPAGLLTLALDTLVVAGLRLDSARLTLDAADRTAGRLALGLGSATGPRGRMSLAYSVSGDTTRLLIDTLGALIGDRQWTLASPSRVTLDSTGAAVDSLAVVADGGARVVLAGEFPSTRPVNASLRMYQVPLADLGALAQSPSPLGGLLTLEMSVAGRREDPTLQLSATADTVRIGTLRIPRLDGRARYASQRLTGELRLLRDAQPAINLTASLPIDLALAEVEKRLIDDSLRVSVRADSVDFALLEAMVSTIENAQGKLQAHLDVGGTWTRPTFAGEVGVRGAQLGLAKLGIQLRDIHGHLSLSGDSVPVIQLDSLVMASGPHRASRAFLGGTVRFSGRPSSECDAGTASIAECLAQRSAFDIRFRADNFEAIRQRRLADLEIGGNLQLAGTYGGSTLTGGLRVERGAIYLRERLRKQIVDVDALTAEEVGAFIDTTFGGPPPIGQRPAWMTGIVNNLSVNNVDIAIGEDVWLRSQEASIKLGGSVSVTRQGNRLALEGPLLANRGTYRLYLAPGVIRTFEVQRGVITFFGGPVIDPSLDIVAVHTVRQAGSDRRDVRIRVTIGGTLSQPRLALSSDERIQISETQILSYLVSGQPTFIAENSGQIQTAFATILPTLGAIAERAIIEQLRFLDMFQLQTTQNRQFYQLNNNDPLGVIWQSRIAFGKQLTERTFLSANAGLCSIGGQDAQNHRFLDAFGLTLEHRLNHGFSLEMSVEPATSAALCRTDAVEFNRPRQFGLDLFREWSF